MIDGLCLIYIGFMVDNPKVGIEPVKQVRYDIKEM